MMIVSRVDGGLGNQMFQYAFGLYLARKHQTDLVLDLSSYASGPQHGYMLDHFQIEATAATPVDQRRFPVRYRTGSAARLRFPDWLNPQILRRIKEKPFGFQARYLNARDDSILVGYWQSEKFFPGLRSELLEQFSLRLPLSIKSQQVVERMHTCPSVALHVRRGDYLTNPDTARIYEQLSRTYYQRCIDQWAATQTNAQAFIFSNDLAWCQENLQLPVRTQFVNHTTPATAYEDMAMMSHAACCVTANSTFSWWAAYLNQRTDKLIFVPQLWFRPNTLDASHIACESWCAMDAHEPPCLPKVA